MLHISDLKALPKEERDEILRKLGPKKVDELLHTWEFFARPNQIPPKTND